LREDAGAVAEGILIDELMAASSESTPMITITGPNISCV